MNALPLQLLSRLGEITPERLYLVGGTVRDLLLRRKFIKDIDIVTQAGSEKIARQLADAAGGSFFFLDEKRHMSRVIVPGDEGPWQFDFADFEGSDLAADLRRRDFTVNAMALDLREYLDEGSLDRCDLIDLFGGRRDLERGVIRLVAPSVLDDDPLRMLRAARFSAVLGFTIDPGTAREIASRAEYILASSAERIRDELFLILAEPGAGGNLLLLLSLGLLERLVPELISLKGFSPGKHHQYDILTHSIKTANYVDQALKELGSIAGTEYGDRIGRHMQESLEQGVTRMSALRFGCLLHDIAKSETFSRDEDGEVHFYGHDQQGADRARGICERFRLSKATASVIEKLVRHHMRPLQLAQTNGPSRRALYRYCRDLKDAVPESVLLALADGKATSEVMPDGFKDTGSTAAIIMQYYYEKYLKAEEKPLLTGRDLIALGMRPGPEFRELLEAVREHQAEGTVRDRSGALDLVGRMTALRKPI